MILIWAQMRLLVKGRISAYDFFYKIISYLVHFIPKLVSKEL